MIREHWVNSDTMSLPEVKAFDLIFSMDDMANRVGVNVTKEGEPVELQGSVIGYIVKPDGSTITTAGQKQGNKAWVDLPAAAYTTPGLVSVFVKVTDENRTITLGGVEGICYKAR